MSNSSLDEFCQLISRVSSLIVCNYVANRLFPPLHTVWLFFTCLGIASSVRSTSMFQRTVQLSRQMINRSAYPAPERKDLLLALYDLSRYKQCSKRWNNHRKANFRRLSQRYQKICTSAGYVDKLMSADGYFEKNNATVERILKSGLDAHSVSQQEFDSAKLYADSIDHQDYYRVVEALCHFARDWSPAMYNAEVKPLVEYILKHSKDLPAKDTHVVVPGSGLGRVAHELAGSGFKHVDAVEFSWLMALCHQSMYGDGKRETATIYPYLHNYSSHFHTKDQFRSADFRYGDKQPSNLSVKHGDFLKYNAEDPDRQNVLIVTCFFLDTAENILEYFDAVNRVCDQFKGKKRWINVGPLKYGTQPKVEFDYDEISAVRSEMGWKCTHELEDPKVLGYMTDEEGLWRGYYGVTMWTAERQD